MNITFSGSRALIVGGTCELAHTLAASMIESSLFPILTYRSDEGLSALRKALSRYEGNYAVEYLKFGEEVYGYFAENISFRAEVLKTAGRIMLKKRKGRLVFISSTAAARPNPGQGFYAAAKLASEALYRNMGLELGGRGITTIILRPGYVNAGRGRAYIEEKNVLEAVPIKRAVTKEEIAETVLFLLSESAAGMNATVITMDGGLTVGK
jgi:3-oxoacyl-[acyl-carrier protein] reductase